jgi:hypothetical protein
MSLRALDLYSGTGSITKAFREAGHECHSLDIDARFGPTFHENVMTWDFGALPSGHYDAIWASCPCEQYSLARSNALTPRDLALADALVLRTLEIIAHFKPRCWFLENPSTSMLWRRFEWPLVVKTSYCSYGFRYRKHTTFATNLTNFTLRGRCGGAGVCASMIGTHHAEHAQKGGKKGGGVDNVCHTRDELHRIPEGLCRDVVRCVEAGAERVAVSTPPL